MSSPTRILLVGLCLLLPLTACRKPASPTPDNKEPPTEKEKAGEKKAPVPSPGMEPALAPVPVAALMSQVHFAFRAMGDEHLAWHDTYTARVHEGRLTITPQQTRKNRGRGGRVLSELVAGAPLTVRLVAIEKGGEALALKPGTVAVASDGAVVRDLGAVTERFINGEAGVTLSWTFAEAPAGDGELEVRLAVSGARHVGGTTEGQHFAARPGELGVRAGPAAWKDAAGKDKVRDVRRVDGELRFKVPGRFVETGVTPLRMELALTPELGLDKPISGPLRVNQEEPALAPIDQGYLAVWRDFRGGKQNDIWAARLSRGGKLLDPSGLLIHRGAFSSDRPVVARGAGGQLLVAWEAYRGGKSGFDIMAARVTEVGTVLDPDGLVVAGVPGSQMWPQVTFSGGHYLLVWEDQRGGKHDIYGARVSADGEVLNPGGLPINTAGRHKKHPALCGWRDQALVVWTDYRDVPGDGPDIYGTRVSAAGEVLDAEGFLLGAQAGEQSFPAVGCGGAGYLVMWQDRQPGAESGTDIHGARVSADGKVLDPSGRVLVAAMGEQEQVAVNWDDKVGAYLAAWQDRRASNQVDVYGARVDTAGKVLDPGGRIISSARSFQERPAVSSDGVGFLVLWQDRRHGGSYDIYGARVSATGLVQDARGFNVSGVPYAQVSPRLAAGKGGAMVVWQDFRGDGYGDILGARLVPDGSTIKVADRAGLNLSRAQGKQQDPDLASGGDDYLVVWQDRGEDPGGDIMGALVSGVTGEVKVSVKVAGGEAAASRPAVGFSDGAFWVVWQQVRQRGQGEEIVGVRLGADGKLMAQAPVVISAARGQGWQGRPRLTAGRSKGLLVVWEDRRTDGAGDIRGARLGAKGEVLTAHGLTVSVSAGAQTRPAVAPLGDDYLVVWQDERPGRSGADIRGARVSADGKVLDPAGVRLTGAEGYMVRPAVAWDGHRALLAWQEGGPSDILGTVLEPGGKAIRGGPAGTTVLSDQDISELSPAVISWGARSFLIAYQVFDPAARADISRVEVRVVQPGPAVNPIAR